jgi:hypothetical protein
MELKQKIVTLLLQEKKRFPQSEIQDYYKIVFQSVFGAAHLVKDPVSTIEYLNKEWNQMTGDKSIEWTFDISLTIPMVRLNLKRCKAEGIPLPEIAHVFLEGCQNFENPIGSKFPEILQLTCEILASSPFDCTQEELNQKLPLVTERDFPIMHHSRIYRELYQPHYRVIPLKNRKLWF